MAAHTPLPSQAAAPPGTLLPGQPSGRPSIPGTQPTVSGAKPGAAAGPNPGRGAGSRLVQASTAGCSPSPDASPVRQHQLGRESPGSSSAWEASCSKSPEGSLDPIPSTSTALDSSDSGLWGSPSDQLGLHPGETLPARVWLYSSGGSTEDHALGQSGRSRHLVARLCVQLASQECHGTWVDMSLNRRRPVGEPPANPWGSTQMNPACKRLASFCHARCQEAALTPSFAPAATAAACGDTEWRPGVVCRLDTCLQAFLSVAQQGVCQRAGLCTFNSPELLQWRPVSEDLPVSPIAAAARAQTSAAHCCTVQRKPCSAALQRGTSPPCSVPPLGNGTSLALQPGPPGHPNTGPSFSATPPDCPWQGQPSLPTCYALLTDSGPSVHCTAACAQNQGPALQRITSRRHALAAEAGALRPNKAVSERGSAADLAALDVGSGSGGNWEHKGAHGGPDSTFHASWVAWQVG